MKNIIKIILPAILVMNCSILASPAVYQYPWQDPNLPVEKRIDNLLSIMTLDEKIDCLNSFNSVSSLNIRGTGHVEGLHGVARGGPSNWGRFGRLSTTIFPQAIGMGETWDPEIVRQMGTVEGYEARYIYNNPTKYRRGSVIVRAPNADIGRDPRWGRTEECFGEDPYFNGTMVVAMVHGLQGNDPKYWMTASLMKHFLANSNENHRESTSSNFDERLFREYYSVPFRMGIEEGHSNAFMAAYNAVNGIPCTVQPILKDVAEKEWGLNGIICTDGGSIRLLVSDHKYYPDLAHAATGAVKAGISQFLDRVRPAVPDALDKKLLTESDIDAVIRGNFRVFIKLGLLDPPEMVPYSRMTEPEEPWLSEKHQSIARLATQKSIVLLKNSSNLLPLNVSNVSTIAVIGPRADEVLLDWYSGTPPYRITPLQGIKNKVGKDAVVTYAVDNIDGEAVYNAKKSQVAIVCVGNQPVGNGEWGDVSQPSYGREGVDRESLTLEQEELIKQVYAANTNTIVVLISSFPYAINWTQKNVPAILHMTHCSEETGNALADVIFGDYNPAGRLVETWPKSLEQLPPMMDYNIRDGKTYMYFRGDPLYPFGYGLSYTKFSYSNLKVSSSTLKSDGEINISIDVTNTGTRLGEEVVQMYVKHFGSSVVRPSKELKWFKRVSIEPGENKTITFPLKAEQLAYWDSKQQKFIVEKDKIQLMIGSSSADIKANALVDVVD